MTWEIKNNRPIYLQLVDHVYSDILSGHYLPGQRLPSVRNLAKDASVNPNTMQKALQELEHNHIVYSKGTSGRFVTDDPALISSMKERFIQKELDDFLSRLQTYGITRQDILDRLQ